MKGDAHNCSDDDPFDTPMWLEAWDTIAGFEATHNACLGCAMAEGSAPTSEELREYAQALGMLARHDAYVQQQLNGFRR